MPLPVPPLIVLPEITAPGLAEDKRIAVPLAAAGSVCVIVLFSTWVPVVLLITANVASSMLVLFRIVIPLLGVAAPGVLMSAALLPTFP